MKRKLLSYLFTGAVVAKSVLMPVGPQAVVQELVIDHPEKTSGAVLDVVKAVSQSVQSKWHKVEPSGTPNRDVNQGMSK